MDIMKFCDVISKLKIELVDDFIKDYSMSCLKDPKTGRELLTVIKLQLNTKYNFEEKTLRIIKERFEADDYYITVKRNQLHMKIKCYYKDEDRRTGAIRAESGV